MKLKLLRIDEFIEKKKVQQVKDSKHYAGNNREEFNKEGIFSQEIFGRVGSISRKKTFGYIDLHGTFIHPEGFKILTSINTDLTKLIFGSENYIINEQGNLIKDSEKGSTGIYFFIENFENINFNNLTTNKPKYIEYVLKYKKDILITKYLILPAGIRDIQMSSTGQNFILNSEVNILYTRLINQTNIFANMELIDDEIYLSLTKNIQSTLNEINVWIKSKIKGKYGIIRGGLLKKVVDYCARLVIVPDTKIKFGYVGIPWHICLKLFEPMFIHYLLKEDPSDMIKTLIQQELGLDELDINDIKHFNNKINESPLEISELIKRELFKVAEIITTDKVVITKRDPVECRDSWQAQYVTVQDTGFVLTLNNFDLCKNGGDYDGDTMAVYALLTNEAQQQAKSKMNVINTKSGWTPINNYNKCVYEINMDGAATVYMATLN